MGGFTEGWTGGKIPNAAAKMIKEAIDRDIAAQRANIVAKQGSARMQQGLVGMLYNKLGDIDRSAQLTRIALMEQMKQKLLVVATKYRGKTAGIKAWQAANSLQRETLRDTQQLKDRAFGTIQSGGTTQKVSGARLNAQERAKHLDMMLKMSRLKGEDRRERKHQVDIASKMQLSGAAKKEYDALIKAVGMLEYAKYRLDKVDPAAFGLQAKAPKNEARTYYTKILTPLAFDAIKIMQGAGIVTDRDFDKGVGVYQDPNWVFDTATTKADLAQGINFSYQRAMINLRNLIMRETQAQPWRAQYLAPASRFVQAVGNGALRGDFDALYGIDQTNKNRSPE